MGARVKQEMGLAGGATKRWTGNWVVGVATAGDEGRGSHGRSGEEREDASIPVKTHGINEG